MYNYVNIKKHCLYQCILFFYSLQNCCNIFYLHMYKATTYWSKFEGCILRRSHLPTAYIIDYFISIKSIMSFLAQEVPRNQPNL